MYRKKKKKVNNHVHNHGKNTAQYHQMTRKTEAAIAEKIFGQCGCDREMRYDEKRYAAAGKETAAKRI